MSVHMFENVKFPPTDRNFRRREHFHSFSLFRFSASPHSASEALPPAASTIFALAFRSFTSQSGTFAPHFYSILEDRAKLRNNVPRQHQGHNNSGPLDADGDVGCNKGSPRFLSAHTVPRTSDSPWNTASLWKPWSRRLSLSHGRKALCTLHLSPLSPPSDWAAHGFSPGPLQAPCTPHHAGKCCGKISWQQHCCFQRTASGHISEKNHL